MKSLTKLFFVFAVVFSNLNLVCAQNTKKAERQAAIKKMIGDVNYVFEANIAYPQTGGNIQLTAEWDLKVTRDTVTAFLPYFGRAYMAPDTPDETEGGIKFTTVNFYYSTKQKKNGNWEILIKPKNNNIIDWRDVQQLTLDVSQDGYATLQVINTNRDPISFNGFIEGIKGKN